jgi:hypothetical protein
VRGRTVATDASTQYEKKKTSCSSVRNGVDVSVKGVRWSDGTVRAQTIEVDNDDDDDDD